MTAHIKPGRLPANPDQTLAHLEGLMAEWLPALDGVVQRLERGARVADIACQRGTAAIWMALAFPRSRFVGFDGDASAIEAAREGAARARVSDRVAFELAEDGDLPGAGYDLVTHLKGLQREGDPASTARRVRRALAPTGTWMLVVPGSAELSWPRARAIETSLREIATRGGFSRFRGAARSRFHFVFEARA